MKKKFSWKAFISFGLTYAFVIIFLSGLMLYASPPGRYAHWVDWKILGFTKDGWGALHIIFSLAFVVLSIFHLFTINWQSFLSYMKSKKRKGLNKKREFYISTVLTLAFFFGVIYSIPPFIYVSDFGEYLTQSWEQVEDEPPIPHAELLTLAELAEQLDLVLVDEITRKLELHDIEFSNTDEQTLQDIAKLNNTTPIEIYEIFTRKRSSQGGSGVGRQGGSGGSVSGGSSGGGMGRKTIVDFADEVGKTQDEVLSILGENGIDVKEGQTLRDIGDSNDINPRDLYELFEK
ncbi:MAG: DUF4405 domain-containing protein [Draconibacterium sp.]|nr:DUF4405 domain-containing protein [Draconibacterium sp.]